MKRMPKVRGYVLASKGAQLTDLMSKSLAEMIKVQMSNCVINLDVEEAKY